MSVEAMWSMWAYPKVQQASSLALESDHAWFERVEM